MASVRIPSGGSIMNGIVYVPPGAGPHPVVVLLHGYPGDERNLDLAQALRRAGFTVLFFHYRGAWGSDGVYSFGGALEDAKAAVAFVRTPAFTGEHRADPSHVALVGHSVGGFLALVAGSELDEVQCVVSLAGANPGVLAEAIEADPGLREPTAARLDELGSGPIRGATGDELVAELLALAPAFDTRARAEDLAGKALLLVAGARDDVTPPSAHHAPLVAALQGAGARRLDVVELDSDHAFSDVRVALARLVIDWLRDRCF